MTEELRLVLLLGGILIFGYIIWDAKRRQNKNQTIVNSDEDLQIQNQQLQGTPPLVDTDTDIANDGYDELGLTQVRIINGPDLKTNANSLKNLDSTQELNSQVEEVARVEPSFNEDINDKTTIEPEITLQPTAENDPQALRDSSNLESMQKPETVITVNIMADTNSEFSGEILLQELLTLGFKYGEMGVFHRYQNSNGQGERWFCLANAINPGSFDLENMNKFSTPGLTLFMLLPGPQKPLDAFENMINAANKLQATLGGKLEDGSHSVLTQQRIQHYREEILNFQRQHLAKINHADQT
jgi:cell division protein ZipA